jgi:hypothetical protein
MSLFSVTIVTRREGFRPDLVEKVIRIDEKHVNKNHHNCEHFKDQLELDQLEIRRAQS